jgi:hypothetical protein
VHGHYWPDLLPLYLVFALGLAFAFIPVTIARFIGVPPHQAGLASGLQPSSSSTAPMCPLPRTEAVTVSS